jgi:hypothetical protein
MIFCPRQPLSVLKEPDPERLRTRAMLPLTFTDIARVRPQLLTSRGAGSRRREGPEETFAASDGVW